MKSEIKLTLRLWKQNVKDTSMNYQTWRVDFKKSQKVETKTYNIF